jgi:hypothetical protein
MKNILDKIGKILRTFVATKLVEYPAGSLDNPIVRTQNYDLGEATDG